MEMVRQTCNNKELVRSNHKNCQIFAPAAAQAREQAGVVSCCPHMSAHRLHQGMETRLLPATPVRDRFGESRCKGAVNRKDKLQGVMRVRVEGLSDSPQYNGQLGTIQREVEGGRLRVATDQDGKVLSLKRKNLVEVQPGHDGHVESKCAGKHTALQQRSYDRSGSGDGMLVYNVCAPKGFQRRSTLERGMRDWFDDGETTTNKCVLCGPGGIGKSTLVYIICVRTYIPVYYVYICILAKERYGVMPGEAPV